MTTETQDAVRHSGSPLWLVAGVPALLIIVYLIYSAVSQSGQPAEADPSDHQPAAPSTDDSGTPSEDR